MIFVDYAFEKVNKNILFDKDLDPQLLDITSGDKFVVHINENNRLLLVRIQDDVQ